MMCFAVCQSALINASHKGTQISMKSFRLLSVYFTKMASKIPNNISTRKFEFIGGYCYRQVDLDEEDHNVVEAVVVVVVVDAGGL